MTMQAVDMSSNPVVSYKISDAPEVLQKWCERWYKQAKAAGINNTKLFAKTIQRPNNLPVNYHLSLIVLGNPPKTKSFGKLRIDEITEDVLREATRQIMVDAGVTAFDY